MTEDSIAKSAPLKSLLSQAQSLADELSQRDSFKAKFTEAQSMYQQTFREKRDMEKELAATLASLRQEIASVRKQNRDLRVEKNQQIEYQRP